MYERTRYLVIFLVVVLLFLLGLLIFRGSGSPKNVKTNKTTANLPKSISQYNNDSSYVRLTIDGPVNADQNHRMIRITVAQDQNNLDIFQGYQYTSLGTYGFGSNKDAYNDFLYALQNGGFDKTLDRRSANYYGMCPQGSRYIFEVFDNQERISQRWSASCGNMGNFGGRTALMLSLFKAQIPDYSKLTSGIGI